MSNSSCVSIWTDQSSKNVRRAINALINQPRITACKTLAPTHGYHRTENKKVQRVVQRCLLIWYDHAQYDALCGLLQKMLGSSIEILPFSPHN